MKELYLEQVMGNFAENKDKAKKIRLEHIMPTIEKGDTILLDFKNVDSATQGFIHALISEPLRIYGDELLDKVLFRNCSDEVKKVIEMVVEYMQESM